MYNHILRDFSKYTSVHGLSHVVKSKKYWKLLWIVVWLIMLSLLLWSCINSTLMYFRFDVETRIMYQSLHDTEFPAITICSENQFTRSIAGSNSILLLIELLYRSYKFEEAMNAVGEVELLLLAKVLLLKRTVVLFQQMKYCRSTGPSLENISLDSSQFLQLFSKVGRDSFKSVEKCWWGDEEIKCAGNFFNHLLDQGLCFTFGHNPIFIQNNLGKRS